MRNKTVVKIWCIGIAVSFCGGFISGFNGGDDGLSALLTLGGTITCLITTIVAMRRLWKAVD